MIKVNSDLEILTTLKDDFQTVLKHQKIEKIMIFKGENVDLYIRIQFNKNEKGLDRLSFSRNQYAGAITFAKLGIKRVEEFNLKSDLKLGMFIDKNKLEPINNEA